MHCQYDSNNTFASATINGFPLPITKTIIADSNTEGNVDDLAKWTLCREVGKAIKYQIFISKSKIAEKPFKVGDLFRLISSKIRTDKNLVLERIEKDIGTNQRIVLTAVLPNSYNGVVPEIGELL